MGTRLRSGQDTRPSFGLHHDIRRAVSMRVACSMVCVSTSLIICDFPDGMSDGASIPTFETCIRYLGGFLAAYDLSGDELMLKRGRELGDWLLGAFGTSSGLPLGRYKLGYNPEGKPAGRQVLAEAGSMLLEMTRLSQLTGDDRYFKAVRIDAFFSEDGDINSRCICAGPENNRFLR